MSTNSQHAHRPPRPDLARRAAAEALAAFALVFAGCGAIVANARSDDALGPVGVSLVFGLIVMVMVYATGHLSGAHINPAVTIAFTLTRHFPIRDAAAYVTLGPGGRERWGRLATSPQMQERRELLLAAARAADGSDPPLWDPLRAALLDAERYGLEQLQSPAS